MLLMILYSSSCAQDVVLSPEAFNASEGSTAVDFYCGARIREIRSINFEIGGRIISEGDQEAERRGMRMYRIDVAYAVLSIEPRLTNNGTTFVCVVSTSPNLGHFRKSSEGILLVQGILSPPRDLHIIESTSSSMILLWTAPYSLNLTDVKPDIIGYNVCSNFTNLNYSCINTSETSLTFSNVHMTIEFVVTAINIVGESNASSIIFKPPIQSKSNYC